MNEKTETKSAPELEALQGTRHQLAKVVPLEESRVDLFNPKRWTNEDIDTIKKTVCPAGIPDADFKLFIMKCQASGMNPLLGEAFCIKRNQNIGTKDNPKWIEVFQFTPGEQGMEGRADDFPDFRGLRAAAVYSNDKIIIDPSSGEVSHQFNPAGDRGRLLGAWALAYREGRKTPVEYVKLDEYADARNPKWATSPATMIVKCARAAALRRAYPNAFDGIFVREELRDDGAEQLTPAQAEEAGKPTTDRLADRMKATAAAADALRPGAASAPPKAGASTVTVHVERPKTEAPPPGEPAKPEEPKLPSQQADERKAAEAAKGPLMQFGEKKHTPIRDLTGPQILEFITFGEKKMTDPSLKDTQRAKLRQSIEDLKAEEKRRMDALVGASEGAPSREPGSDDDID